jgi:hypothetical protein
MAVVMSFPVPMKARAIYLSDEARAILLSGFRGRWSHGAIQEALAKVGCTVSTRSISRWFSAWRGKENLVDLARNQAMAIAAGSGQCFALEALAERVSLSPSWRPERDALIQDSFRKFLRAPSPEKLAALNFQCTCLLFENELAAMKQRRTMLCV